MQWHADHEEDEHVKALRQQNLDWKYMDQKARNWEIRENLKKLVPDGVVLLPESIQYHSPLICVEEYVRNHMDKVQAREDVEMQIDSNINRKGTSAKKSKISLLDSNRTETEKT